MLAVMAALPVASTVPLRWPRIRMLSSVTVLRWSERLYLLKMLESSGTDVDLSNSGARTWITNGVSL